MSAPDISIKLEMSGAVNGVSLDDSKVLETIFNPEHPVTGRY